MRGLRTFRAVSHLVGVVLGKRKTDLGRMVAYIGLEGTFPSPDSDMLLRLELTAAKKEKWAAHLDRYIATGSIPHKELESLTGRLSYSQTSIFWEVWEGDDATALSEMLCGFLRPGYIWANDVKFPTVGGYCEKHRTAGHIS